MTFGLEIAGDFRLFLRKSHAISDLRGDHPYSELRGDHPTLEIDNRSLCAPRPGRQRGQSSDTAGTLADRRLAARRLVTPHARCVHARWLAAQGGVAWLGSLHGGGAVSAVPHMAAFLPGGIVRRTQRVCVRRGGWVRARRAYHSSKRTSAHTKRLPARPPQHVGPAGSEDAQLSKHLPIVPCVHMRTTPTWTEMKEWCFNQLHHVEMPRMRWCATRLPHDGDRQSVAHE